MYGIILRIMKSYSVDFRACVLRKLDEGMARAEVVNFFKISPATLTIWLRKRRETGDIAPVKRGRYKTRKLDDSALLSYIKEHNDSTLAEIAEQMNVSATAVRKRLIILGVSRKKNHAVRRAGREKETSIFS
jgi:transposase